MLSYFSVKGGAASVAGVLLNPIKNESDGTFSLKDFRAKIRGSDPLHEPRTSLVIVENTQNVCGGKVMPLDWMDELASICKNNDIKMHMDGARVFSAAEYLKVPVSRVCRDFDSVMFCLSKSLCAPVGSVIVGSKEFIQYARRMRTLLGGAMPQVGVLAAAGLVALKEVAPNITHDHRHAKQIAQAIYDLKSPYVTVDIDNVQTNICLIRLPKPDKYSAKHFLERLLQISNKELLAGVTDKAGDGIIVKVCGIDEWEFVRIVTYIHINDEITDLVIKKLKYCIEEIN